MAIRSTLLAPLTVAISCALSTPTLAQHTHDHGDHSHGEIAKPKSFSEAVHALNTSFVAIKAQLAGPSPSLAQISDESFRMSIIAKGLGALALAKDSGVERDQVKAMNLAGKEIFAQSDSLHDLADARKLAEVRATFPKLEAAIASLGAPPVPGDARAIALRSAYFCPMHCEGDKTYSAPGVCPVCDMKLKLRDAAPYSVSVMPVEGSITAGRPVNLKFELKDPKGQLVKDLAVVHEMPLHLLMVSSDLSWYAHEHPTLHSDGTFTMPFTFPAPGTFTLFHDFTPSGAGMQVVPVELNVLAEGSAQTSHPTSPRALKPDTDTPKVINGYTVKLSTPDRLVTGSPQPLAYTISKGDTPVTSIVPYLGAMGHLVVISSDRTQFVHSHPHDAGHAHDDAHDHDHDHGHTHDHAPLAKDARGGPTITFDAYFSEPGLYKGWAQFNIVSDSKDSAAAPTLITVPFTFTVHATPSKKPVAVEPTHDNDHKHDHDHDHKHP